jgi:eukaryotic-like serine/threonine-protein kinase
MSLMNGDRIGSYEITGALGAGGMGEVYRARDTRLKRDVALKILPETFAADPDRLARFQREAEVLASLNHPNVAAIYGIEESPAEAGHYVRALVMELVEGPTLADRIVRGPIPVDEALPIAKQIAEAVEAAHEQNIIHRDLKPANIKIRPDGTVKVLDFGLAKALEPAASGQSTTRTNAPTVTSPAMVTGVGVLLGTAAYMSPEQAKRRPADKRSDIWAFACVLYEMLTGKRAFEGDEVSDTLAAVLRSEPDWNGLPRETPAPIRVLLRRCLEKDPRRRLPDIGVARLELGENEYAPISDVTRNPGTRWRNSAGLALALIAGAGLAVFGLGLWGSSSGQSTRLPVLRSTLDLGIVPEELGTDFFALSSDGRRIAFVATAGSGRPMLWVRALDSMTAQPLAGTEGAGAPFWSPDSQSIGFIAGGQLKRIAATGGDVLTLCPVAFVAPGAWSRDDVILFTPRNDSGLFRVPAAGGTPVAVTALNAEAAETRHSYPTFLPDGRHFLFLVSAGGGTHLGVDIGSLDSPDRTRVLLEGSNTAYADGHLIFVLNNRLVALSFDPERQEISGEPFTLADDVVTGINSGAGAFTVSDTGLLVVRTTEGAAAPRLVWYTRDGTELGTVGEPDDYGELRLSPDGSYASFSLRDSSGQFDVWKLDLARAVRTRLTFNPADDAFGLWSPDANRVVFASRRAGRLNLYSKLANGEGDEQVLVEDAFDKFPQSWSPDGASLMYQVQSASTASDLWWLRLSEPHNPQLFIGTSFSEGNAAFSPDGRWVAYTSNRTGRAEVYLTSFPDAGRTEKVSSIGGAYPSWRADGGELFYQSGDVMMAAPVMFQGANVKMGAEQRLFEVRYRRGRGRAFDVSSDGKRFLFAVAADSSSSASATLVVNWPGLKGVVPTN